MPIHVLQTEDVATPPTWGLLLRGLLIATGHAGQRLRHVAPITRLIKLPEFPGAQRKVVSRWQLTAAWSPMGLCCEEATTGRPAHPDRQAARQACYQLPNKQAATCMQAGFIQMMFQMKWKKLIIQISIKFVKSKKSI